MLPVEEAEATAVVVAAEAAAFVDSMQEADALVVMTAMTRVARQGGMQAAGAAAAGVPERVQAADATRSFCRGPILSG